MAGEAGFIKLSRKYFDHPFFKEKREYSRAEAWLDLIQMCAYEEGNQTFLKGRLIVWGRGQVVASVRYLQQRWNWKSVDKVFSFLEVLRSQNMIKTDNEQGIGRITLCKYDDYNDHPNTKRTHIRTKGEQSPNEIKEDKERKERKKEEGEPSPIVKSFKIFTFQEFIELVDQHRANYSESMVNDFLNYWTEPSPSGKMKFQTKETWETGRRLATWLKKEKQFSNGTVRKQTVGESIQTVNSVFANLQRDMDAAERQWGETEPDESQ